MKTRQLRQAPPLTKDLDPALIFTPFGVISHGSLTPGLYVATFNRLAQSASSYMNHKADGHLRLRHMSCHFKIEQYYMIIH